MPANPGMGQEVVLVGLDSPRHAELHAMLVARIADIRNPQSTMPIIALVDAAAEVETELWSHLERMKEDAIIVLQRAVKQVETGTYGNCRVRRHDHDNQPCNRRISMRRLRKFPLTGKCGTCERKELRHRPQIRRR